MHFIKKITIVLNDLLMFFITYMPGVTGNKLRYLYYRNKLKKCGNNVIIDHGVTISNPEFISIGDNVHIDRYCILAAGKVDAKVLKIKRRNNPDFEFDEGELLIGNNVHIVQFCIIMAFGGIYIGNNCVLSAGTKIYSLTNISNDPDDPGQIVSIMPYGPSSPFLMSPVVLEDNVWITLNCIIMPGVSIGKNSFVVSNSVVMNKFPENSYIYGQPAQKVRERFPKSKK